MASGDPNQLQIIAGGGYVKDAIIGGMQGPMPEPQPRHWIPDERDNFISWLRGEFAAANAIIDSVCHHLQMVGNPGEYDYVLSSIQQRRLNWTVVLHMQQYFSVAEVVFALQRVVWLRQTQNCEPSGMPPLFASPENGGIPLWKDGPQTPYYYRDPRSESHIPSTPHQYSVQENQGVPRKDSMEGLRNSDQQGDRRTVELGDQGGRHQSGESSSVPVTEQYVNRDPSDQAELSTAEVSSSNADATLSETSSVPSPPSPSTEIPDLKEEKDSPDHGSQEQDVTTSTKSEGSEDCAARSSDKSDTPFFHLPSKEEDDRRRAVVKATRSYRCVEQIEGKMFNTADGLELHEIVLDHSECTQLASVIQDIRTAAKRGEQPGSATSSHRKGGKGRGRERLHFGRPHHNSPEDHKKRSFSRDDHLPPVPPVLEAVIDRLVRWQVIPASKRPDCCIVNFMEEGDYLPPHAETSLERPYCIIALQSECSLVFGHSLTTATPGDFKGPLQICLPIGSVLIFQRSSAESAKHGIESSSHKRILITLGKAQPTRQQRGYNNNVQSSPGISAPPVRGTPGPSSSSWAPSNSHNGNRQGGAGTSSFQQNSSGRPGGGFQAPFKGRKYSPSPRSTPSPSGGVLPNPVPRPPPTAQIVPNVGSPVPPLFGATPGPAAGGAFPPPSLSLPPWSPLPRPPIANTGRPPSTGTGVFFPSGGSSSGPGRPTNLAPLRRSGNNNIPPGPPVLQKTNSAPASFASLEASAIAAAAAATATTSPGKSSYKSGKPGASYTTPTSSSERTEKTLQESSPPGRGWTPSMTGANPQESGITSEKASPPADPQSEPNGSKSVTKEEDNPAVRSSARSSQSSVTANTGTKAVAASNNGGGAGGGAQ